MERDASLLDGFTPDRCRHYSPIAVTIPLKYFCRFLLYLYTCIHTQHMCMDIFMHFYSKSTLNYICVCSKFTTILIPTFIEFQAEFSPWKSMNFIFSEVIISFAILKLFLFGYALINLLIFLFFRKVNLP